MAQSLSSTLLQKESAGILESLKVKYTYIPIIVLLLVLLKALSADIQLEVIVEWQSAIIVTRTVYIHTYRKNSMRGHVEK